MRKRPPRPAASALFASLLLAAMLLAGCSGGDGGDGDGGPSGSDGRGPGTLPPAAGEVSSWALPECRQASLTLVQERGAASEGLPPGAELQGEGFGTLVLLALDCPSAVAGNLSVVAPFRLALVYHLLRPIDDRSGAIDAFLREGFASDAATARRMAAFGLPVAVAEVALSAPGDPLSLEVTAPGVHYRSQGGPPPQEPGPTSGSFLYRFARFAGGHWTWLEDRSTLLAAAGVSSPVLVQAEGGYLGQALPGGASPALREDFVTTSALALASSAPAPPAAR